MGMFRKTGQNPGREAKGGRAGDAKLARSDPELRGGSPLEVRSAAFANGAAIPRRYTGEGDEVSPPLHWSSAPEGTQELVLLCEDPDAPMATPFVHWVLYHLGPATTSLPESAARRAGEDELRGAQQGRNSMRGDGYLGPMPPPGHGTHHYHFELFALDAPLSLGPRAAKDEVLAAMRGHVLASGDLVGTYER